jgi:hypothetical protein
MADVLTTTERGAPRRLKDMGDGTFAEVVYPANSTGGVPAVTATGNVAGGATDSGNPLKTGAIYNTTLPTYTNGQRTETQAGSRGSTNVTILGPNTANAVVTGAAGDATADNQVKLHTFSYGAVFNGTTWDRQRGNTVGTSSIPTADVTGGASFLNIAAGQATTVVKASAGTLYSIVLNSAATATNTTVIYDNATGAGTVIGRPAVTTATVPTTLNFGPTGIAFANGLTIITAVANGGDMTVVYK